LVVVIERIAVQIFVGAISHGNRSTRQDVLNPTAKTCLFQLRSMQGIVNCFQARGHPNPIGLPISVGRTGLKVPIARPAPQQAVRASPQKSLEHKDMSGPRVVSEDVP
jgi:hypothetical protein